MNPWVPAPVTGGRFYTELFGWGAQDEHNWEISCMATVVFESWRRSPVSAAAAE